MRPLLAFLHVLGATLWIGGALTAMVMGVAARREDAAGRGAILRALSRVHVLIVGPGALLTVGSGLLLVMVFVQNDMGARLGTPYVSAMMGAGLVAGLLALVVGLPTAQKLAGLAVPDGEGRFPPALERFRKRLAVVSSVAGVLALVALYCGVVGA